MILESGGNTQTRGLHTQDSWQNSMPASHHQTEVAGNQNGNLQGTLTTWEFRWNLAPAEHVLCSSTGPQTIQHSCPIYQWLAKLWGAVAGGRMRSWRERRGCNVWCLTRAWVEGEENAPGESIGGREGIERRGPGKVRQRDCCMRWRELGEWWHDQAERSKGGRIKKGKKHGSK